MGIGLVRFALCRGSIVFICTPPTRRQSSFPFIGETVTISSGGKDEDGFWAAEIGFLYSQVVPTVVLWLAGVS